jgi:SAM-dependent methyltransferase
VNGSTTRLRPIAVGFATAIFLSSSLLFLIEPLAGKRVLPLLGGSAAVWAACLVFFQTALLIGYLIAHWLVTRVSARAQIVIFGMLLVLSVGQLLAAVDPHLRANASHPIASVLWLLTALIGLPFVTLSSASPLFQAWYARAAHTSVEVTEPPVAQPYRLFAVSNVGSLLALLSYPWLFEPRLTLREQATTLTIGLAVLLIVFAGVALVVWRSGASPVPVNESVGESRSSDDSIERRLFWILLAACGSLLLSATTNHLSQNVAAIPLLWIIPLVLYLLSFVVAFGNERWRPRVVLAALAGLGMAAVAHYQWKGDYYAPIIRVVATYTGALFFISLFCHAELYARRPAPARLTTFYLCVATGGALGAIAVGVVAPTVLTGTYEVIIGLVLAAALAVCALWSMGWIVRVFCLAATSLMIALLVTRVRTHSSPGNLVRVRNFYGTLRVSQSINDAYYKATVRTLFNGIIEHGQQVFRVDLGREPTTYYGRASGIGLALDNCCDQRPRRIGVIGLGTGTIAAYGRPGDIIRFYDINPAVEPIARHYFAYLRNSPARIDVVTGDARVSLSAEPPQAFDVLAIDAFTGDAIPVHLLTSEALQLYRRHLKPDGIVAFHVSNHFLDLAPVVEQLAKHVGLHTVLVSAGGDRAKDLDSSDWVLVTADNSFVNLAAIDSASEEITVPPKLRRWTDDYNSLLPILRKR